MKIKHLFLSLLAVATVAAAGCTKDKSNDKPSLKLDPSSLEFEAVAGTKTVKVDANQAWEIDEFDADWVTPSKTKGDGAAEIEVSVLENSSVTREAKITFRCSIVKKTLTITQDGAGGTIEEGDGTEEKPYTVAQAKAKAEALGTNAYSDAPVYVSGIVVSLQNAATTISTYGSVTMYISDDGKSANQFYVYALLGYGGAKFTSEDSLPFKAGSKVVLYGYLQNYYGNTPEMTKKENVAPRLVSVGGDAPVVETVTVEGVVVAASGISFIVKDAEGGLNLVYGKDAAAKVKVGDTVSVEGVEGEHNGTPQITSPTVTVNQSGATVSHPTATALTGSNIESYTTVLGYVKLSGTLSISRGSYYDNYNIVIDDNTTVQGTIAAPVDDISGLDGVPVTVSGYYLYRSVLGTTTYFNILATNVESAGSYLKVTPTSIDVAAAATSATINVKSNVAWTAASETEGFTIDNASSNGDATITVTFAANTDTAASKTATVKVTTTDTNIKEVDRTVTVTINQGRYVDTGNLTVDVLTADLFKATSTTYTDFTDVKAPTSTAVYAGNNAKTSKSEIQLRSSNNAGIVSTTSGGKIRKVVVTWGSGTAEGRTLDIYGSASAYTTAADLYDDSKSGKKLGSIICGTSTELVITGDYDYVGLRSNKSAMYISKIELSYE